LINISIFIQGAIFIHGNQIPIILINVLRGTTTSVPLIVHLRKTNYNRLLEVQPASAADVSFGTIPVC
jgi:hypothetical protein